MKAAFWISLAVVVYTYLAYPLLVLLMSRWFAARESSSAGEFQQSATLILAVRNEARAIVRRVTELLDHMDRMPRCDELIVVSDGSSDDTVTLLDGFSDSRLRTIILPSNVGKAAAVSKAADVARNEILVFADVRQRWEPETLSHLLSHFATPKVGGVSGELVLESGVGGAQPVGLYWKYEKWIRRAESALHSTVGVSGCVAAVRKALFKPIPSGTILDDVYWPMNVVMQGYRVLHDERAVAVDRLPEQVEAEFRRKVRTLSGNFQLLQLMPGLLLPWRYPTWWQFMSHKVARLLVPWALIIMLLASGFSQGAFYQGIFWLQIAGLALAATSLMARNVVPIPGAGALGAFVMLNFAAFIAFWVWVKGGSASVWNQTGYHGSNK